MPTLQLFYFVNHIITKKTQFFLYNKKIANNNIEKFKK